MAERNKARVVDGFTTLRATQRHARERRYSVRTDESETKPEPASPESSPRKPGMQVGRTVMPTTYEIVCYSCGYAFVMRGRAQSTQCPKCGARLGLTDETITGAYTEELITAGKVHLTSTAILDGGKITANDVILEGTVKSGFVHAYKTLELGNRAKIPEELFTARSLRIGPGAKFTFKKKMELRDLELLGELKADITAEGIVTVHPGGHFKGALKAAHLSVEEGGGLNAAVSIHQEGDAMDLPPAAEKEAGGSDPAEAPEEDLPPKLKVL